MYRKHEIAVGHPIKPSGSSIGLKVQVFGSPPWETQRMVLGEFALAPGGWTCSDRRIKETRIPVPMCTSCTE